MSSQRVLIFAALFAQNVLGSYYHGPTAVPHVRHDGYLADTHEVAAAKSAHLATLASQTHGNYHDYTGTQQGYGAHGGYLRPFATPQVLHDGHIADTHEVAAAKAEHFAAVAKARAHGAHHHGDYSSQYAAGHDHYSGATGAYQRYGAHGGYHGPLAVPHVLHDGHIADTHEVAAAKAEHFAAVAKARAHGTHLHDDYSSQYAAGYDHYSGNSGAYHGYAAHGGYHGPLARPVVLPSGYLADTQDVAAIRHKHKIAHANQHHSHSSTSHHYVH